MTQCYYVTDEVSFVDLAQPRMAWEETPSGRQEQAGTQTWMGGTSQGLGPVLYKHEKSELSTLRNVEVYSYLLLTVDILSSYF